MNSAEINYLSSESVCRLFMFEEDKRLAFLNSYEVTRDRVVKEIEKMASSKVINFSNKNNILSGDEIIESFSSVIEKYNDLIDLLISNKNYTFVNRELKRIQDSISSILYELSLIGVDITLSSKICIDKKRMKKKIADDPQFVKKYLFKESGLLDKIMFLIKTSNINYDQITKNDGKKAMVMNMASKVKGKTISHEPYFIIAEADSNDI